ncbi:MAG: zinc ribbon domain-containing protein [Firmicutes bacterium]|nr:zinc ribbon domain-containing protein [Bacillota bacterium]
MTCFKCGNIQNDEFEFCLKCGARVGGGFFCRACELELPPDTVFCGKCGRKLDGGMESVPETDAEPRRRRARASAGAEGAPYYERRAVKKASHITAVWIFAAVFLLMFGLSFGSFFKFEMSLTVPGPYGYGGTTETVTLRASSIDVLVAAVSKKKIVDEIDNDLSRIVRSGMTVKDLEKALQDYGFLKLVFNDDAMKAAPFSARFSLYAYSLAALAMLALSGTFFGICLGRAVKLTRTKDAQKYKPLRYGGFLAATAALSLVARLTVGRGSARVEDLVFTGSAGYGVTAMIWISLAGLAVFLAFNLALAGRRYPSYKRLVAGGVSALAASTLMFSLGAPALSLKFVSDGISAKAGYRVDDAAAAIDNTINYRDAEYSLTDVRAADIVADVINWLNYGADDRTALSLLHPANTAFMHELSFDHRMNTTSASIAAFVSFYVTVAFAALTFAFAAAYVADVTGGKGRGTVFFSIGMLLGAALLLTSAILSVSAGKAVFDVVRGASVWREIDLTIRIGAACFVNCALAAGTLIQNGVLLFAAKRKKTETAAVPPELPEISAAG